MIYRCRTIGISAFKFRSVALIPRCQEQELDFHSLQSPYRRTWENHFKIRFCFQKYRIFMPSRISRRWTVTTPRDENREFQVAFSCILICRWDSVSKMRIKSIIMKVIPHGTIGCAHEFNGSNWATGSVVPGFIVCSFCWIVSLYITFVHT